MWKHFVLTSALPQSTQRGKSTYHILNPDGSARKAVHDEQHRFDFLITHRYNHRHRDFPPRTTCIVVLARTCQPNRTHLKQLCLTKNLHLIRKTPFVVVYIWNYDARYRESLIQLESEQIDLGLWLR
jgi:hypothetical protein